MIHYQRRLNTAIRGNSIRSDIPLTYDQIMAVAPSIMATEKHSSRSDRYTYVPTIDILAGLQKEGFEPFFVTQAKPRNEDRHGFAKHMVRMRHASTIAGTEANEIIIINSHDGTTGAQIIAGVFRAACANGCIAGDILEDIRVRHTGKIVDEVIEGSFRILDGFDLVNRSMEDMKSIILSRSEQHAFAVSALALKYENPKEAPIVASQLLAPRRASDTGLDLWATMNVVQENLVRGGLRGSTVDATGKLKRATTRAVNGISENVKLNKAIWNLTEAMKNIKTGAAV